MKSNSTVLPGREEGLNPLTPPCTHPRHVPPRIYVTENMEIWWSFPNTRKWVINLLMRGRCVLIGPRAL